MNHNRKILIIGAGIAGPTLCYWLKQHGFEPTLIERNRQLRTGGYAVDIRGIAADIVKKMGLYSKINEKCTSLLSTRYVDADGQILSEEHGEKAHFRQGDDVEIVRGELINILLQAIPDIPCHFNQEIINLTQENQCVEVIYKDSRIERYDLVLAADGLHSPTRRMTFPDKDCNFFNLSSYISVFSIPNYLNLNRVQVLFEKDQKLIGVTSDKDPDHALVSLAFRTKKPLNHITNTKEQKECLRDTFYNLGWESNKIIECMNDSNDFYFDIMAQIKMESWSKHRVALVGDAGYCASPLSGQGTNLAIVGAYILAGELKLAKGDYSIAFERYNKVMRPFVNANQDLGVWLREHFLTDSDVSKELAEQRSSMITEKIKAAVNRISLPQYV